MNPKTVALIGSLGTTAILVIEYLLPRIKSVRARSILEGVANVIGMALPVIGTKFGTPPAPLPAMDAVAKEVEAKSNG